MSAPTVQPAQPDQSAPPAHQVAHQAPLVQPALLVLLEQLAQVPRVLPEPPARMAQPEPQVLPDLTAPLELRVQLAWALRAPLALRVPVLPAQLEPQVRPVQE